MLEGGKMIERMHWGAQEQGCRKGPWTPEEDRLLIEYVNFHGDGRWSSVARSAGLNRSGKSCRLRWVNYLRPGLKRGQMTPQEEGIIVELHALWGNKWSTIARYLPGRTDNEIKNYWRTHFKKKDKSSKKQEKPKAQTLKQQQRQQEVQPQDKESMKRVILPQVASHEVMKMTGEQGRQEVDFTYDSMEDQCIPNVMSPDAASWSDHSAVDEGFLWSGLWLWDQDDPYSRMDHTCNYDKAVNPISDFYSGG